MVVSIKDAAKLVLISAITCCASLVCTMFLNFYLDILSVRDMISSAQAMIFYNAQVATIKVVCLVCGGCLAALTVVMLFFYIKHYTDTHKNTLGILKALGFSDIKTAKNFWVFGISVFIGTAVGFCGAFLLMPNFYMLQNKDNILPAISIHFHLPLLFEVVILPSLIFSLLSVLYALVKLREPAVSLLRGAPETVKIKADKGAKELDFKQELGRNTLRRRKILVFFITFASFCFSSMTQMSASMRELSSAMMGIMIFIIGLILACSILFLSITTVINGNIKAVFLMRAFGYSAAECRSALLDRYRPLSYAGFALGTAYQYVLLRLMVDIVFKDVAGMPVYKFNIPIMLASLAGFIAVYEAMMYGCLKRLDKVSIKEIMLG